MDPPPVMLLLVSSLVMFMCQGGRVLVWCPGGSQSVRITYLPLVDRLVQNGNEVVIVTPFPSKQEAKGTTEIPVVSRFQEIFDSFSM